MKQTNKQNLQNLYTHARTHPPTLGSKWLFKVEDICFERWFKTVDCIVPVVVFVYFIVPVGIFPWEIQVAFPKDSQLQQGCAAAQPKLIASLVVVYAVFLCDHTTGCEACSSTTDGYGIFNMHTSFGACCTHTNGRQTQMSLHKSWLRGIEKRVPHSAPPGDQNPRVFWIPTLYHCPSPHPALPGYPTLGSSDSDAYHLSHVPRGSELRHLTDMSDALTSSLSSMDCLWSDRLPVCFSGAWSSPSCLPGCWCWSVSSSSWPGDPSTPKCVATLLTTSPRNWRWVNESPWRHACLSMGRGLPVSGKCEGKQLVAYA